MCGGHGLHHLLDLAATDSAQIKNTQRHSDGHGQYPSGMEQQVKLMYARGEIGAEAFRRLLDLAHTGDLKPGDLAAFQSRVNDNHLLSRENRRQEHESASVFSPTQQRRHELEAACAETEESIRRLRLEAAQWNQQAESAASDSKREKALAQAGLIEDRVEHIKARLSILRTQLDELTAQEKLFTA